jgi:hypothetical protein
MQPPAGLAGFGGAQAPPEDSTTGYRIQLEPPGPDRLFRLDSEDALFERVRQEAHMLTPPDVLTFPKEPVLSTTPYYGRRWPSIQEPVEPHYVCYERLLFEQKNFERGGWDLGIITPVVSALSFYKDVALLPYHNFTDPCRHHECSAGYCLPGDPVPLLLYPPEPSLSGALAEAGAVAAVVAIFP